MLIHQESWKQKRKLQGCFFSNCGARTTMTNNYYCFNERTYPLNGINLFKAHLSHMATNNPHKATIISDLDSLINLVLMRAKACLGTVSQVSSNELATMASAVTTITNSVENTNLNSFLNSRAPKNKAPTEEHQKNFFLRDLGYYDYLTKVNQRLASTNGNSIAALISASYSNKDIMSDVFHSLYTTNEAYYTGGAIVHVVGGQMGAQNAFLIKQDLESSFMLNFGMGYEHSIEFLIGYQTADTNVKSYYLYEMLSKLAKYLIRTKKAIEDQYYPSCVQNQNQRTTISAVAFTGNNQIPTTYTAIMTFLGDIKIVKDNQNKLLSNGNQFQRQDSLNGQITVVVSLFDAFCLTRNFQNTQREDCILSIYKDMTDFVNKKYTTLFGHS